MTRFDVIKQMNVEDLAFFLSIIEWGDLNSIPNIDNESINYYINYLKEEDNDLIDILHKLNKSRHDYKEIRMMIDEWAGCKADKCPYGKEYGDCDACSYLIRKPNKAETEVEDA